MKKTIVAVAVLTSFLCNSAFGAWSTVTLGQRWPAWYDQTPQQTVNNVINLNPGDFPGQILSNAAVQINDAGEWLIMGYGDPSFGDTAVGDAIWVIKRQLNGTYVRPPSPALAYPAEAGKRWDQVGGLGFGAGFAKTPNATVAGDRYFALIPLEDFHATSPHFWVTWAMSPNGETGWRFPSILGGTTTNPNSSLRLIRRSDVANDARFLHPVMFYNPTDGYFYIVLGYWSKKPGEEKINGLWFRIKYDPNNPYGLKYTPGYGYEVERLNGSSYVVSDGGLPYPDGAWINNAQLPRSVAPNFTGVADPAGLIRLTKPDGTFDSMLFLYRPEVTFNSEIYYVRGTSQTGTFGFENATPRLLDMTSLKNCSGGDCYSACTAGSGGAFMTGPVQSGWQADGNPRVFGYATSYRKDLYPWFSAPPNCQNNAAGFLPIQLNLSQ